MKLTLSEYQERAMTTCMESSNNIPYMLLMIGEETGELQGKFSKAIRKGNLTFVENIMTGFYENKDDFNEWTDSVKKEIGDIMWGLAGICHVMKWDLGDIGQMNLDKLASRKQRNVIDGNGDNR